eukprot:4383055-Pleurochrysis_carterae.AAC.1
MRVRRGAYACAAKSGVSVRAGSANKMHAAKVDCKRNMVWAFSTLSAEATGGTNKMLGMPRAEL